MTGLALLESNTQTEYSLALFSFTTSQPQFHLVTLQAMAKLLTNVSLNTQISRKNFLFSFCEWKAATVELMQLVFSWVKLLWADIFLQ